MMFGEAQQGMSSASAGQGGCLAISLRSAASSVRTSDGREIPFARAMLTIHNICGTEVADLVPQASLGQEGGTIQNVAHAFAGTAPASIPPGGSVAWDVYDLLLPAHAGSASKVHMFGHRAVLNWRFELAAWAQYQLKGSSGPEKTPTKRWAFWWSVPDRDSGAVTLTIEDVKE
jgi:hypothetical protein